jgi:hypothetical protein
MTTTMSALGLPFEEAIEYLRQKTNVTSTGWTDVWQKANAKAFTVAGATALALVDDFRREVAKALETGSTLQEFRARFGEIVRKHGWEHTGRPGWRARVIYETNLSMAYSAGRYAQQTEPETLAAFPYWQYVHSGAKHPRKQHLAWNGTVLRADDPFWDWAYPPNGWGCGCRVRPVSEAGLKRQGRAGVDQAPERLRITQVNRKTGEVLKGSQGVDIGFDYNPGQAWKAAPTGEVPGLARPAAVARDLPTPGLPSSDLPGRDQALAEQQADWAASLSLAEKRAIAAYKGPAGFLINEALRSGALRPQLAEAASTLERAIGRARLKQPLTAWRGEGARSPNLVAAVGDILSDRGFASFSIDAAMASEMGAAGVVMEVRLPAGYRAAYVNRIPRMSAEPEYELVIAPGARFKVVARDGNRLVLEVVDGG